ncbi:MAG: orotate phosphoribosyltransferase [Oscillospiraceae bacterium]|jgi:orotate phosphoribosyltransferase|nr:orotate phosphoribosyltransferase [Oscillospiraceae bacterium]
MTTNQKQSFISFMKACDVLRFGQFTTKSGRVSPYFINTGNYKTGKQLSVLADYYADTIAASGEAYDALFGPAYKGIPLAAAVSAKLWEKHGIDTPYFFNRKEAKDHGEGGIFVGYVPKAGDKIAVIEDVITAGTAVRETVALLSDTGAGVSSLFVSVDRCERGTGEKSALRELAEEYNINVYSIVSARDLLETFSSDDENYIRISEYLSRYGGAE